MAVVVTGAAGFLGCHLVEHFRACGTDVVAIDRRALEPRAGVERLVADLTAPTVEVLDALRSADAVVHLAGCPGVRDDTPDVAHRRYRDNVLATCLVLDATPLATPLVTTSSSSVYGGTSGRPCAETDPLRPRGGYARSKVLAEQLCARRRASGGVVTVVRPFTVAGAGQRPDMAISRWLAAAAAGEPLVVFGGLDRRRDVTDVADVTRALGMLVQRPASTTVNLGTGRWHTLREHVDAVAAAVGRPVEVVVRPAARVEPAATLADTRHCKRVLGFVPRTDLAAVVARQAAAVGSRLELVS